MYAVVDEKNKYKKSYQSFRSNLLWRFFQPDVRLDAAVTNDDAVLPAAAGLVAVAAAACVDFLGTVGCDGTMPVVCSTQLG